MEEEPSDPYEQQLLAVYKSCLTIGKKELNHAGLTALCRKLELEDAHKKVVMELLENKNTVSFYEFRDGFLNLLGKSQQDSTRGISMGRKRKTQR